MLCAISSFAMANILHFSTKSKCSISHFNICETEGRCGENNRGRGDSKQGRRESYHGCGESYHGCGEGKHGHGEGYNGRGEDYKALKECYKAPSLRSTGRPQKAAKIA